MTDWPVGHVHSKERDNRGSNGTEAFQGPFLSQKLREESLKEEADSCEVE